jgi:hypothetical protein
MEKASAKYGIPFRTIANEIKMPSAASRKVSSFFSAEEKQAFAFCSKNRQYCRLYFFLTCTSTFLNLINLLL